MKWYISSRTQHRNLVKSFMSYLELNGHETLYDWTKLEFLKPFNSEVNDEKCRKISSDISKALENFDVFVLISDAEGTDMFVELGMAIIYKIKNNKSRIYVVGKYNKRSLMHFHPFIIHVDSLNDVLIKEKIPLDLSF